MIEAVVSTVDRQMSPYDASSDLSLFNAEHGLVWQKMPPAVCYVTAQALRIARLTNGAFDPTVGPIVARYGFGPIKGGDGSFTQIEARATALRKATPQLTLDLCGIAKGYALDQIAATLRRAGVGNALIEVGGEVKAIGRHPSGRHWSVAIADPGAVDFKARRIVALDGRALATSGHAANGLSGSIATSHIIDARNKKPASTLLLSVSVLSETAIEADALATAFCAAGPVAGKALAFRLDADALFVVETSDGAKDVMTGRFAEHILI
jgi:thiamine biosynthesis lipoprotein